MRVARRRGRLLLQLEPAEADVLLMLFDELDALLDGDGDDAVLERLNPAAYPDDEPAEREYRALTAESLHTARNERTAACRADLSRSRDVELSDPDTGKRWIQVLNDLRLALGTRLGITEDDDHNFDADEPAGRPRFIYYWLTALQDELVQGLMH